MSRWRRAALAAGLLAGVALGALLAAFALGLTIDATPWRERAEQQASAALDRPVALHGALRLTLGREVTLRVGGLVVRSPPDFAAPELLAVGRTTVVADLFDVLRGTPRLQVVEADDVTLWLERAADGRSNWAGAARSEPAATPSELHVGRFRLNRVAVRHHDARDATHRELDFESVSGAMPADGAVQLRLQGLLDARPAYRVTLEGGPLRQLQAGAGPWPFTLAVQAGGAMFDAKGRFDAGVGVSTFDFSAAADDPARVARLLGVALPPLGRVSLRGTVAAAADGVELSGLHATLPGAELTGQLAWNPKRERPQLTGDLRIADLDLGPSLAAVVRAPSLPGAPGATPGPGGRAWEAILLPQSLPFDAAIELGVERWTGLPLDVRALRLRLQADDRRVQVPIELQLAGSSASGQIDLDTSAAVPALALQFSASAVPLGELSRSLAGLAGVEGSVGRLRVRAEGTGATLGAWLRNLDAAVEATDVQASLADVSAAAPSALRIDALQLRAPRGERLRGSASGSVQGESVALSLSGARLPQMLDEPRLPIDLTLASRAATLRVTTDLAAWQGAPEVALDFDLRARHAGDLAPWLGVAADSTLPVTLTGQWRRTERAWSLDRSMLRAGRSDMAVQASGPRHAVGAPATVLVRSALLDVPELTTLRRTSPPSEPPAGEAGLPAPLALADVDLRLELQQVKLARAELRDLGLEARLRHGQVLPAALKGRVGSTPFDGRVELDLQGQAPTGRLELAARQVDVGLLLRELGATEDLIEGRADALTLSLATSGADIVGRAEVRARWTGGHLALRRSAQQALAEIQVREATVDLAPGDALRMQLDGTLDQTPVNIALSTGTLADGLGAAQTLPLDMTARGAGTLLKLKGKVALPLGRAADLHLHWSGERLDSLNGLSQVELPAWGPWSVAGPIRWTPQGYEVPDLQLRVGQSRLGGSGRLDLSAARPHLALQVTAPSIQLDDFPLPQQLSEPPLRKPPADALRGTAGVVTGRTDRLLSARFLRRFDADVDVHVNEVLSGADPLADAALRLKLREGRLELDPVWVNIPGGGMRMSAAYDLKETEVDFRLAAAVERFDYGIIARRLGRGDDIQGLFSLRMQLQGRAPSLGETLLGADGSIDIAVWPTELRSGVFNLWSVNLVLSLIPLIDPGSSSGVNCVIGRFDLNDGVVSEDTLLIDTTRVRIRGSGGANLRTEQLDFVFRPRGKGVAIFRLQNPLRVTGTLSDQRIGLDRRDLPESILRLIASPILWPIEQLTLGWMPRDGSDICIDPLRTLVP